MLELDVMLERFVSRSYASLEGDQLAAFLRLLECEDDQLWDWLSGRKSPDDPIMAALCGQIRRPH